MSKARQRRRLLALRRADVRFSRALGMTVFDHRNSISGALMRWSFIVPWKRQWYPPC